MSLGEWIKSQFVDIIEWVDDSRDILVWKFPRYKDEIKVGAKLTVRESQAAVFVNKGQIADVYPPGLHELKTDNMPVLASILGWKYGFNSPFKVDVYFVNTRLFTDQKWGTQNPIIVRDPELGPVRLRAFGTYTYRVGDPAKLIRTVAGTDPLFTQEEITQQLRNYVVSRFADFVASAKVPLYDLASQYDEIGAGARAKINEDFRDLGIELPTFLLENVSVPPEVEKALDKRAQMGVIGNLNQYAQFQAAEAIGDAARNPGPAGMMMGMGVGGALGQQMTGAMAAGQGAAAAPAAATTGAACPAGHANAGGARFCNQCGKPIGPPTCPKCNTPAAPGAKFCSNCGGAIA